MARRYAHVVGPDGRVFSHIEETALPCPGVALRLNTVIDCTPGEDRMTPITIDFLKNVPPQQQSDGGGGGAAQLAGRFTCDCGDFLLFSQLKRVQGMVEAVGLPLECAPALRDFFRLSAASGANAFFKAMVITVEAGAPGSIVVDEHEDDDDEEEVPDGAAAGECAICYKEYLVGGVTSTKLPCGHTFHCRCLDRWTSVNRTCPYCRAPVPYEHNYWDSDEEEDAEFYADHYEAELWAIEEFLGPGGDDGETPSAEATSGSQPS